MRRILTIDGGGIKGVIPSVFINSLEKFTGKLSREIFDFVGGTSTGALLTGGIACGLSGEQLIDIYLNKTKEIFSPGVPLNFIDRILSGHQYNPQNIYKVLSQEFGSSKDWMLNDCPIDIFIPAKRVSDAKQFYFVKDNSVNKQLTGHLKLIDCCVSSACAPTYFTPWNIPEIGELVDGGTGIAGNPVYVACIEAFFKSGGKYTPENTSVLSLGTGLYPIKNAKPEGLLGWLEWSLTSLLNSPEQEQIQIVKRTWPNMPLLRINPILPENYQMDDPSAVQPLYELAQEIALKIDWESFLK